MQKPQLVDAFSPVPLLLTRLQGGLAFPELGHEGGYEYCEGFQGLPICLGSVILESANRRAVHQWATHKRCEGASKRHFISACLPKPPSVDCISCCSR
jgi:hypothetical protein